MGGAVGHNRRVARHRVVESFGSGRLRATGWVMLAIVVAFLADVVIEWQGRDALLPLAIATFIGVGCWIVSIRPWVVAYDDELLVRNFLRDGRMQWAAIREAQMQGDLVVIPVDETNSRVRSVAVQARRPDRYQGINGMKNALGFGGATALADRATVSTPVDQAEQMRAPAERAPQRSAHPSIERPTRGDQAKGQYTVDRIESMAKRAKFTTPQMNRWTVSWAIPECVALALSAVLLIVAIVLH